MHLRLSMPQVLFSIHLTVALTLVWLASLRKTRRDQPLCRKCGTDLRPFAVQSPPSCPTCSSDLCAPGAVRFATERPHWIPILLAVLLLASSALWPTIIWSYLTRVTALAHLNRATKNLLPGERARNPHWWDPGLFRAVGAMRKAKYITQLETEAAFDQMLDGQIELASQPSVREGRPLRMVMTYHGLLPDPNSYICRPTALSDGASLLSPVRRIQPAASDDLHGMSPTHDDRFDVTHSLKPGRYDLFPLCEFTLNTAGSTFVFKRQFPLQLRVTRFDQPAVETVSDRSLEKNIRACFGVRECYVTPWVYHHHLQIDWKFAKNIKEVFYYDVWVIAGGRVFPMGGLSNLAYLSEHSEHILPGGISLPADLKTVTIRLVPNPEQAENLFGADRLPAYPIEFHDVPLNRYDLQEFWATTRPGGLGR